MPEELDRLTLKRAHHLVQCYPRIELKTEMTGFSLVVRDDLKGKPIMEFIWNATGRVLQTHPCSSSVGEPALTAMAALIGFSIESMTQLYIAKAESPENIIDIATRRV